MKLFFKYYFKNLYFQLQQNVPWTDEMTRVISASASINSVRLAPYIS